MHNLKPTAPFFVDDIRKIIPFTNEFLIFAVTFPGYGLCKIVEAIQVKCADKKGSFCHQFDLIAGTSVGGISALLVNRNSYL